MPAALCASHTASQGVSTACWVVSYLAPKSYIITCFLGPLLATGSQMRFSGRVSSEMQLGVRGIYCGRKGEEAGLSRGKVKLLFRPPQKISFNPMGILEHIYHVKANFYLVKMGRYSYSYLSKPLDVSPSLLTPWKCIP